MIGQREGTKDAVRADLVFSETKKKEKRSRLTFVKNFMGGERRAGNLRELEPEDRFEIMIIDLKS